MSFPPRSSRDCRSATITQTLGLILACSAILALTTWAAQPPWWSSRGAVNVSLGTNDYAVVVQGQLKQFTARAVDEMNAHGGGAGTPLSNLVYGWQQDYLTNGYATNTANPSRPYKPSDYQTVNVGQLKYVGKLVWSQLITQGYATATPAWLATTNAADYSAANIGQLKTVFNFLLAPGITSATTGTSTVGSSFSYTITASHTPISYSVSGLLPGLSINTSTGVISGTPTSAGTFMVTLGATNAGGTGTTTFTLTVAAAVPVITSSTTASATAGAFFTYVTAASGTPTGFSATGLPTGLSVNTSTGLISGTPTASGTSTITLGATDAGGMGTATLTLTVSNPPAPVITSGTAASGDAGTPFNYTITASNSPTNFSAGVLPGGLSINTSAGLISGTPLSTGTSTVVVGAMNAGGTGTASLTLTINGAGAPVLNGATTANAFYSMAFTYTISATNTPMSFNTGTLPPGLSVNTSTGVISGTLSSTGFSTFSSTVTATNSSGTANGTLIFTLNQPPPTITSSATATANEGSTFNYMITATNSPVSFNATGLPPGLNMNSATGLISGVPVTQTPSGAPDVIGVSAANAGGTGTGTLTLTVNVPSPAPVINSGTMASGDVGSAFSYTITTSTIPGSTTPTFSATGLPGGLSLNTSTGVISGSPTGTGTSTVTLGATNAWGTGNETLTILVNPAGAPVITSATTGTSTVGSSFSYTVTASNSPTNYAASGLPAGLSLNAGTGAITGTPTAVGGSTAMLTAVNSVGTGVANLTVTINPPPPTITSSLTASGTFGAFASYAVSATNNPTNYAAASLPPGMLIDPIGGVVSGTPTESGTFSTILSAANAGGTGTATLTYTIGALSGAPITTRSIAAGDYHTLLLKSDGTVWARGYNLEGGLGNGGHATSLSYTQVSGLSNIVAVAGEGYTSLALDKNGHVWSWGRGAYGELGTGTTAESDVPAEISSLSGIIAIAGGDDFGLALQNNGTVWAWGDNNSSDLGNTGTMVSSIPGQVLTSTGTLSQITAVACGGYHALALKNDGTVWAWGNNTTGALGTGTVSSGSAEAVQVSGLTGVFAIAGGGGVSSGDYSLAVKNDGTVVAWGDNTGNRLGNGAIYSTTPYSASPVTVMNLTGVVSVYANRFDEALALKNDGSVWTWGDNILGELGNGTVVTPNGSPTPVAGLEGIVTLAAGMYHDVAIKNDGTVWAWGENSNAQTGYSGASTQSALPVTVGNLSGITAIAGNKSHYLALKNDGTVWTWVDTAPGTVYSGTTTQSVAAIQVSSLGGISGSVTAVACGEYSNFVLTSAGNVWSWGGNKNGQLGNGTNSDSQTPMEVTTSGSSTLSGITSIACGAGFGLALKNDGTVWAWGRNDVGQLGIGTETETNVATQTSSLTSVSSIAVGAFHALALKNDGTLWAWGYNNEGQLGIGSTTSSSSPVQVTGITGTITALAGAYYNSLALTSGGNVWICGENTDGELGIGTTTGTTVLTNISSLSGVNKLAIGVDSFHSVVLKSDGTLRAWGNNTNGQLGAGVYGPIAGSGPSGSEVPVQTLGITGTITALAMGEFSTIALKSDGTVVQWGDNSYEPYIFAVPIQQADLAPTPAPTITPSAGSYSSSQTIGISTGISGGVIHYTLDGTDPTSASPTYTSSFTLSGSALVNAAVFSSGGAQLSTITSSQFYISDPSNAGLPVAPTSLSITGTSGTEIDLSWSLGSLGNFSNVDIYRSMDSGMTYQLVATLGAGAIAYHDTNIQAGTGYQYYVGTVNSAGESNTASVSGTATTTSTMTISVTTPTGATSLP